MRGKEKLLYTVALLGLFCVILVLSFLFINRISAKTIENEIINSNIGFFLDANELDLDSKFEILDMDSEITDYAASGKTVSYSNKYGDFKFNATKKGKIKKYSSSDLKEGYIIKGTAKFKKCDVSFSGSFYVNESDMVMFYKGDLTLPDGDSYSGTFYIDEKCNSYKYGVYTWWTGDIYKGNFNVYENSSGKDKSCIGDGTNYGIYYFGSEDHYLYIVFKKGIPTGTGIYGKNGVKYVVEYNSNGKCTSIKKKKNQ
jgi:hypothetical protein